MFHYYCLKARATTEMYFFFNDTATTEIYTLSLHDALPISGEEAAAGLSGWADVVEEQLGSFAPEEKEAVMRFLMRDRKSTRLNSSHANISYAVFCLKKNKISSAVF